VTCSVKIAPDDLPPVIDAAAERDPDASERNFDGGEGAAVQKEAVCTRFPNDLPRLLIPLALVTSIVVKLPSSRKKP